MVEVEVPRSPPNDEGMAEGNFHWHLNSHKHLHAECLRKFAPHLCDDISSRGLHTWGSSSSPRELHGCVRKIFVQWKQRPTYKPAQIPCALHNVFALVSTHLTNTSFVYAIPRHQSAHTTGESPPRQLLTTSSSAPTINMNVTYSATSLNAKLTPFLSSSWTLQPPYPSSHLFAHPNDLLPLHHPPHKAYPPLLPNVPPPSWPSTFFCPSTDLFSVT